MIKKITYKVSYLTILVCALISLFWTIVPFFGWSYYSLEGGLTSCSVEWADRSWNVYSYNIAIWILCFMFPLIAIVYCNVSMILIVRIIVL